MKHKTAQQMREAIGDIMKRIGEIDAKCANENREYNDEEKRYLADAHRRVKDLQEQIRLKDETDKLATEINRSQQEPTKTDPAQTDDTERRAAGTLRITREDDPNRFNSLGEFLVAVRVAGDPNIRSFDPRLRITPEERATGLSEGVASEGGFLLQDNFAASMIESVWNQPDLLGKVNKISITKGNDMKIPGINETSRADGSRAGGIQMFWKGEGKAKEASKPDFRMVELKLKKLTGLIYTTDELLEDAPALEAYIRRAFPEEMRFKITDALINGTGAGMPQGILVSPCLVTVAKETGQANTTVVAENIVNMWSRMIASSRLNAVWHINQDVEPQLYTMGITVGTGGSPIFMPPGGLSASPYATLMGRPIIPLEQCKSLGTKGDLFLCDWSKYIAIDKGGLQTAVSIHVMFVYDESVFRFVYRFDGQPELASAITPYSGSGNTLSHFVTLAGRP